MLQKEYLLTVSPHIRSPTFVLTSSPTSELKPNVSRLIWVLVIVKTAFSCRQDGAAGDTEHSPLIQAGICGYDLL